MVLRTNLVPLALLVLTGCGGPDFSATQTDAAQPRQTSAWPEYGGGNGQRYVGSNQLTRDNVDNLELAWVYRTGHVAARRTEAVRSTSAFELTPILADGRLLACTPFLSLIHI